MRTLLDQRFQLAPDIPAVVVAREYLVQREPWPVAAERSFKILGQVVRDPVGVLVSLHLFGENSGG